MSGNTSCYPKEEPMRKPLLSMSSTVFLSFLCLGSSQIYAAIDPDAPVVKLDTTCTVSGTTLDNCFTDLNTLDDWIWNTRNPSATAPLKVEIGPGTFDGNFTCNKSGHVTLAGAGMGNTIIQAPSSPISTTDCVNLAFSDITLKNYGNLFGVRNLGGSTVWNNVEILGLGYAWFDSPGGCTSSTIPGKHYWFNSKIHSETTAAFSSTAYFNACDESWFFGSEIVSRGNEGSSTPIRAEGGEVHVYGSVIRALPDPGATMTEVTAVTSAGTAEIHIHGTGIDLITDMPNDITALKSTGSGTIHAAASSFVMSTGAGGNRTRVDEQGGAIMAPYTWQTDVTPPSINSKDGADSFILYDANAANRHPQMLVSDSNCASGWFVINHGACY